ncbi:PTS glucose transporter subunit IIA [Thalassobacillus sp. CUG 92003]|uniref:PTS sugar transporter subunit IIA n=1 Tax=Thalassobacillus sp. CUG 92003 TaxID=2736641 RepID=UPI0015E64866|nr:PTS glucose transporter subunit IIA [Thalassobacillus sp. CUG 92003]
MLKKLFGHKETTTTVLAPVTGERIALDDVPDPVFSQKMMGEGLAIKPATGEAVAPVDGEVTQLFPTKHAVGLETKTGIEILVHVGLETVSMDGEGFQSNVEQGDRVKAGDKLMPFDIDLINEKASSTITPVIVTNSDQFTVDLLEADHVEAGVSEVMYIQGK